MPYKASSFSTLTSTIDGFRKGGNFQSAVTYLTQNAKVYVDRQLAQNPKGSEKKLWEQSHNLVVSFIEGASTGDVQMKDLKALASDLKSAEKAHEERTYRMTEAQKKAAETAQDLIHQSEHDSYPVSDPKFDHGEGAEAVYEKYEGQMHKLDKTTNKAFIATRAPITVVLSKGFPDMMKLRRTGLCDDLLFGYPVLKNQVLVGFRQEYLTEFQENYKKYLKDKKNNVPTSVSLDVDWDTVSDDIAKELKERTGKSYVKLGKAHRHGKLVWIWMADASELKRLNGTTNTPSFMAEDWALPRAQDMRSVHPNRSRA